MKININNQTINLDSANWSRLKAQQSNAKWWISIIDFLQEWSNSKTTIKLKTSGSTGKQKELIVTKDKLNNSALKTIAFFNLNKTSIGLLCLSANYIAGKMMLVRAIVSGMNLICIEPTSNPTLQINSNIDFAAMVPLQVSKSIENKKQLNLIKNLIIGGGQVSPKLQSSLSSYKGRAYETFGMTETFSHIALRQISPIKEDYFTPLTGVTISQNTNNSLIINAPDIGINNLKTTDLIELNSSGNFKWIGRLDFIINSGGIKISPENLEKDISHILDCPYCIIAIPDEDLGEKLCLVIEGKETNYLDSIDKINEILVGYKRPRLINYINELPKTETGKIIRQKVKELIYPVTFSCN